VAFETQNTINTILKHHAHTDKYKNSGIYQKECLDFPLKYVGRTRRTFNVRYKEHIHAIRSNSANSGYSKHTLNTGHKYVYGTITDTMDVIRTGRKGKHLNTLQKYYIYKISKNSLYMNDTHNHIFQTVREHYDR
jgi:predicted patatin/cPLA2 family phospholipase